MYRIAHCKPQLLCYWTEKAVHSSLNVFCILDFAFSCFQVSWGLQVAGPPRVPVVLPFLQQRSTTPDLCDSCKQQDCWRGLRSQLSACSWEYCHSYVFFSNSCRLVRGCLLMQPIIIIGDCFIETDMSDNVEQLVTLFRGLHWCRGRWWIYNCCDHHSSCLFL